MCCQGNITHKHVCKHTIYTNVACMGLGRRQFLHGKLEKCTDKKTSKKTEYLFFHGVQILTERSFQPYITHHALFQLFLLWKNNMEAIWKGLLPLKYCKFRSFTFLICFLKSAFQQFIMFYSSLFIVSSTELYMGKSNLETLPLFLPGTWILWIFHTQNVTLICFC